MHEETMSHEDALEDWCLNQPSMVQNGSFEIANDTWSWTYDAERVERFVDIIAPQGIYMLKLEGNPSEGASYVVAEQQLHGEPGISGTPLPAKAASRIQSNADRTDKNQGFKARAQTSAAKSSAPTGQSGKK
jgi:hypothetical protein